MEHRTSVAVAMHTTATSCRRSRRSTATHTTASTAHVATPTTVCTQRGPAASANSIAGTYTAIARL